MAQATLDLGGLIAPIRNIVETACRSLAEAIARNCTPARDIAGISQMAVDNAYALWPMLHPRANNDVPDFELIVFGVVPTVRAEIIYEGASGNNVIFVCGPTDVSAEAAVEGLLETTMHAVDQQYHSNVFRDPAERWTSSRLPHARGSGWYGAQ